MDELHQKIKSTLDQIFSHMGVAGDVQCADQTNHEMPSIFVSVSMPEDGRMLIGKNGQNLRALEHIVRTCVAKQHQGPMPSVILDINDYRKMRSQHLVELARQIVNRVRSTQKAEALAPMSSYERRVVHMELASCPDIATESIGEEPQRRVVVKPFRI